MISKIIDCLNLKITDNVLEIGPGDGALTKLLIKNIHHLHNNPAKEKQP